MRDLMAMRRKRNLLSLRRIAFKALLAEAFFIAVWPTAATIAMLAAFVLWLVCWKMDDDFHFRRLPFDVPLFLFVIIAGLSVLVSPDRAFSFYNYYNLIGAYAMTYILAGQLVRTEEELRCMLEAFALGAAVVVLYGFYQFVFGIDISSMKWVDGDAFPELRKRIFSTWENPNILAGYLNEAICIVFAFFVTLEEKKERFMTAGALLCLALCLAMTYARGACLAIAAVIGLYGLFKDRRILLGLAALGVFMFLADPMLAERLSSVFTKIDTSSEMRLAIWESSVEMVCDHPLLGIGWGAYWMAYPEYDFYINDAAVRIVHAHNMYLNYAAETGFFGAAAFLWFFFGTMVHAFLSPAEGEPQIAKAFRLGMGLALLSVALGGLTDDVLFNMPTSMLLWMLCALSASAREMTIE